MSDSKPQLPIDPKDLVPAGIGVALGVALIVGFVLLATTLGLTLFVPQIPYQAFRCHDYHVLLQTHFVNEDLVGRPQLRQNILALRFL